MSAIESFIQKTEAATKARSKEIRVPIQDAQVLVMELSRYLKRENELLKQLNKKLSSQPLQAAAMPSELIMDGGGFKK